MFTKFYSYRFAAEIVEHPNYKNVFTELSDVCQSCPIPVYPGKSDRQSGKDVIQQIMNTYFKLRFQSLGWELEPLVTPDSSQDELRADFRKSFSSTGDRPITAQIEVEFGNIASSYRNYFKFQLSFSYNLTDICVLVVPSQKLANRIDSGVANYEKVVREIPQAKLSITVPILVIGLFDENEDEDGTPSKEWDIKATGVTLAVAKNSNSSVTADHEKLVQSYIDSLPTRL